MRQVLGVEENCLSHKLEMTSIITRLLSRVPKQGCNGELPTVYGGGWQCSQYRCYDGHSTFRKPPKLKSSSKTSDTMGSFGDGCFSLFLYDSCNSPPTVCTYDVAVATAKQCPTMQEFSFSDCHPGFRIEYAVNGNDQGQRTIYVLCP